MVCTPDELLMITMIILQYHILSNPASYRRVTMPNSDIPRVVRPVTCLFYSFCCPFVARYGAALLCRWAVIQSGLVNATELTLNVPFPVIMVLDCSPHKLERGADSERSTPLFNDTGPSLDHELAVQKFSARLRHGVLQHTTLRGSESR